MNRKLCAYLFLGAVAVAQIAFLILRIIG